MEMLAIEIDINVHKLIEHNRKSFSETPNDILSRLLNLGKGVTGEDARESRTEGLFVSGTLIPNGTKLRKNLKGVLHDAEVISGAIIYKAKRYSTPSAAAITAAGNSVNGWIFWEYQDKRTGRWHSLNSLRK